MAFIVHYLSGAAVLGAQGAQLRTHFLTKWQLRSGFSRKKDFENPSKIDRVIGKYLYCAPVFQQLPPPLSILYLFDEKTMKSIFECSKHFCFKRV